MERFRHKIFYLKNLTHIPIKYHNKTPFTDNLNPNYDKNKYKSCQILKLQNENETKNKNPSM